MGRLKTLGGRLSTLGPRLKPHTTATTRIRGRALQRIRKAQFDDNPLCVSCESKGLMRLATVSDHVVALENGGSESKDPRFNRQLLCDECHEAKTKVDNAIARGSATPGGAR